MDSEIEKINALLELIREKDERIKQLMIQNEDLIKLVKRTLELAGK